MIVQPATDPSPRRTTAAKTPFRPETPAERHARRKAWGAHFGPLVGGMIRQAIREADAAA